jgi:hypothetical protein
MNKATLLLLLSRPLIVNGVKLPSSIQASILVS